MKIWSFVILIVVIFIGGAIWFLYSGQYNIAATQPHASPVRWFFTSVKDQSIDHHADRIQLPDLTDPGLVRSGAQHYASTCQVCHGAPGQELSEIAKGMNPPPPELHDGKTQKRYTEKELYWIVANGIRMTGMPAFGPTHKKEDLAAIVAFVGRLPEIKPDEYKSMAGTGGHKPSEREHAG
jgi:mono/diheme cytochrome c family protein